MTPTQTKREKHLFKLKELTKSIINETTRLVSTVNSDVQIFTKKQKDVKKEILAKKLESLEVLLFKTHRLQKKIDLMTKNYKM